MNEARRTAEGYLETIDIKTGQPPKSRLRDASDLREIYTDLELADEDGAFNRSQVRKMVNGAPPYDQAQRHEAGQGDLFNVNTGTARLITDETTSAVMDIFSAERNLVEIPLDPNLPDSGHIQRIIEDEFSKMLHEWDAFFPRVNNLCHSFVTDGVAVAFFEDDDTWKISSFALKDVKFARDYEPVSSEMPTAVLRRKVDIGTLYRRIQDPELAEQRGWNVEATRQAILVNTKRRSEDRFRDWESLESNLKNNEVGTSGVEEPLELLYGFIREFEGEFEGEISLYIATADEKRDRDKMTEFLYKRPARYKSANELYQIFPFSTGDYNTVYSVRGMGHFIYQQCLAENIMFSRLMDAARFNSAVHYQATSKESLEDASFEDMGFGVVFPPGFNIVPLNHNLNLTQTLDPAMKAIETSLRKVSGGLNEGASQMGERANEATISFSLEQLNKMTSFAITLFYPPLDRIYREKVNRVFFQGKDTPESKAMKERLRKAGVTEEEWKRIDLHRVRARRLLSGATKTGRVMMLRQLKAENIANFDDEGRRAISRDITAEIAGRDAATRYHGDPTESRTGIHDWIALGEINDLLEGVEVEALDGQDHLVHLRLKVEALFETTEGVESGMLDVAEYAARNLKLWENAQQHLGMLVAGPSNAEKEEAGRLKQALQQIGEHIANGMRVIQKEQREGNAKQNGAENAEQPELSPIELQMREEQRKDLALQADIARKEKETEAKIARERTEHDVKTALEIKRQ